MYVKVRIQESEMPPIHIRSEEIHTVFAIFKTSSAGPVLLACEVLANLVGSYKAVDLNRNLRLHISFISLELAVVAFINIVLALLQRSFENSDLYVSNILPYTMTMDAFPTIFRLLE